MFFNAHFAVSCPGPVERDCSFLPVTQLLTSVQFSHSCARYACMHVCSGHAAGAVLGEVNSALICTSRDDNNGRGNI